MIVKFGAKRASSAARRPAEQVAGEDARPGGLGVDAQAAAMGRMGADEAVLGVDRAIGEVRHQPGPQPVVVLEGDRAVDLAPPDLRRGARLLDDELVLRRAAGVLAGPDDERALGGDQALAGADRVLVQLGGRAGWPGRSGRSAGRGVGSGVGVVGTGRGLRHRLGLLRAGDRSRSTGRAWLAGSGRRTAREASEEVGFRSRCWRTSYRNPAATCPQPERPGRAVAVRPGDRRCRSRRQAAVEGLAADRRSGRRRPRSRPTAGRAPGRPRAPSRRPRRGSSPPGSR